MDGLETVDAPEIDLGTEEVEAGAELAEEGAEQVEGAEQPEAGPENPYTTKFSREMRAALKQWETANPEAAKYAKQARDNHARLFALTQLEPKGIDGVREKYSLLDSVIHGEAKGADAITAMREELAGVEEIDNLVAQGDPRALESFGDDFNAGLAKLAPAILDRIMKSDPAAYEAAIMPRIASTIASSDLLKFYNDIVDVWNTQGDPRFDEKTKTQFMVTQLAKMGEWFNSLGQKAGQAQPQAAGNTADPLAERQTALEKQEQDFHWNTKIAPLAVAHESKTFDDLFAPYQKRLKLDDAAKADLKKAFKAGMERVGTGDTAYMRQMSLYRRQKNPDPTVVSNYVKGAITKHSKPVLESLVKARYGRFLAAPAQRQAATQQTAPIKAGPVSPNVEVRTVKPPMNEIDHRNTPVAWLAMKQYRLTNGKVVRVVTQ